MRLHIGMLRPEKLFGTVNRQLFDNINLMTAAIVTLAGIAFGVFVGHDRALRFQNGAGDNVFRRDQFDFVALATEFWQPESFSLAAIGPAGDLVRSAARSFAPSLADVG